MTMHNLSAFQRDILRCLAKIENEPDTRSHGLGILARLESDDFGYEDVNHGRLYPNLDELVDAGYVARSEYDARTNSYTLAIDGVRIVRDEAHRWTDAADEL